VSFSAAIAHCSLEAAERSSCREKNTPTPQLNYIRAFFGDWVIWQDLSPTRKPWCDESAKHFLINKIYLIEYHNVWQTTILFGIITKSAVGFADGPAGSQINYKLDTKMIY
jgi:hypothetical protein